MMPLIAHDLLQSIEVLAHAAAMLDRDCVAGIRADPARARELVERSLAMVTALAPRIGYDAAAALAQEAYATGRTVREVALEKKLLAPEELAAILDAKKMTDGGVPTPP
jgi:fumarate hydratase class II